MKRYDDNMRFAHECNLRLLRAPRSTVVVGCNAAGDAQLDGPQRYRVDTRDLVALRACVGDAAEAPEDEDVTGRDDFRSRVDVSDDDEIADVMERLPPAKRACMVEGRYGFGEP